MTLACPCPIPYLAQSFMSVSNCKWANKQNWEDSSDLAMKYRGPFTTEFYRYLHVVLHKGFRSQRAWREFNTAVRRPSKLRPIHLRRTAGMIYRRATLPFARAKLNQLAQQDNSLALAPELSLEEAATPSKQ